MVNPGLKTTSGNLESEISGFDWFKNQNGSRLSLPTRYRPSRPPDLFRSGWPKQQCFCGKSVLILDCDQQSRCSMAQNNNNRVCFKDSNQRWCDCCWLAVNLNQNYMTYPKQDSISYLAQVHLSKIRQISYIRKLSYLAIFLDCLVSMAITNLTNIFISRHPTDS